VEGVLLEAHMSRMYNEFFPLTGALLVLAIWIPFFYSVGLEREADLHGFSSVALGKE